MTYHRTLLLAVFLVLAPCFPQGAHAGTATDQLRSEIDQLFRALQQPGSSGSAQADAILDGMFDWSRMAEVALRGHWAQRTPAERAEFTQLFAGLFRRAYVSRAHVVDASKFQYLGDTTNSDTGLVKTKILTNRGSTISVDYAVRLDGGQRWVVQDVQVERVSLVDNYHTQFETIIGRSSYAGLVNRLRTSVAR
jgi:ABC-type transporter MlaC component